MTINYERKTVRKAQMNVLHPGTSSKSYCDSVGLPKGAGSDPAEKEVKASGEGLAPSTGLKAA